jgi:hypothetical protein
MDFDSVKQATLKHCLEMAQRDPEYAVWVAGEYERQMPWLLKNLKAKVERELRQANKPKD